MPGACSFSRYWARTELQALSRLSGYRDKWGSSDLEEFPSQRASRLSRKGVWWRCVQGAVRTSSARVDKEPDQGGPKSVSSGATWSDLRLWSRVYFHIQVYYSIWVRFSYTSPSLPFLPWAFQTLSEWNLPGVWGTKEPWAAFPRSSVWARSRPQLA